MPTRVCARCTAAFRVRACFRWRAASRFSRCCVCWGVSAAPGTASAAGAPPRRSHAHRTATHAPSWARRQGQSALALSSPRGHPPLQRPARLLGAAPEPERRDVATGAPVLTQSRGLHSPPLPSTPPPACGRAGEAAITATIGAYGVLYCVAHWLPGEEIEISPSEMVSPRRDRDGDGDRDGNGPDSCDGACTALLASFLGLAAAGFVVQAVCIRGQHRGRRLEDEVGLTTPLPPPYHHP